VSSSCWPRGCCGAGASPPGRYSPGLLCLFEVISFTGWTRHGTLDWAYQVTVAVVSLAGLISAIMVLAGRLRRRAAA
jgi:hypothetical protein